MLSDTQLINAVKEAATETYLIFGELGRDSDSRVALLARERSANSLVVLIVTEALGASDDVELHVDVRRDLDSRVPDAGAFCGSCGTQLRPWSRYCQECGQDVSGRSGNGENADAEMRAAVKEAVADTHDFLGEMKRKEGGGFVFFAKERSSGRIAALRLNRTTEDNEFELAQTQLLQRPDKRKMQSVVSVTQMVRALDEDSVLPRAKRLESSLPSPSSRPILEKARSSSEVASLRYRETWQLALGRAVASPSMRRYGGVAIGVVIGVLFALVGWRAIKP